MATPAELPAFVYEGLRTGAPDAQWVRLLALQLRERGSEGFLTSTMRQKILWTGGSCAAEPNVELEPSARRAIAQYFNTDFDLPGWTRVLIECDIDGSSRATAWASAEGPQDVDFVGGHKDGFWQYLDERRAELDALGRSTYG